jgi:hypothetical protein
MVQHWELTLYRVVLRSSEKNIFIFCHEIGGILALNN